MPDIHARTLTFDVVSDILELSKIAGNFPNTDIQSRLLRLRQDIISLRCSVAVVGEFKRGKSTFINALLGRSVLPSDILPTTATVNRVTWGISPRLTLHFRDNQDAKVVPIEELQQYITKLTKESTETAKGIQEAVIEWPLRFCREGIDLIDTPGLEDEAAMTAVTNEVLQSVDVVLLVIMANAPFSETEGMFLDQLLRSNIAHVIVIVNAIDRIRRASDREKVLDAVQKRVRKQVEQTAANLHGRHSKEYEQFMKRYGSLTVCAVSALDALEGRELNEPDLLDKSQMAKVEEILDALVMQSDRLALQSRLTKAFSICDELDQIISTSAQESSSDQNTYIRIQRLLLLCQTSIDKLDKDLLNIRTEIKLYITQHLQERNNFLEKISQSIDAIVSRYESSIPEDMENEYDQSVWDLSDSLHQDLHQSVHLFLDNLSVEINQYIAQKQHKANRRLNAYQFLLSSMVEEMNALSIAISPPDLSNFQLNFDKISVTDLVDDISISADRVCEISTDEQIKESINELNNIPSWKRVMALDFDGPGETWGKLVKHKIFKQYESIDNHFIQTVTRYLDKQMDAVLVPIRLLIQEFNQINIQLIQSEKDGQQILRSEKEDLEAAKTELIRTRARLSRVYDQL
ncbi:MAG: dynamin family protein [Myxococcota bacterium]|nr:dynamin family protein [Myxococcota bacterium]